MAQYMCTYLEEKQFHSKNLLCSYKLISDEEAIAIIIGTESLKGRSKKLKQITVAMDFI